MSLKTGSRWSNWAWDKPVKAFIWRSSRICRPIGGLPPWFFEDSLPHLLLRNNSNEYWAVGPRKRITVYFRGVNPCVRPRDKGYKLIIPNWRISSKILTLPETAEENAQ